MFFIPSSKSSSIKEVTAFFNNKPSLIISDKEGLYLKGSGINYVTSNGKMKYEVNKATIRSHKLNIDPKLISLGIEIN